MARVSKKERRNKVIARAVTLLCQHSIGRYTLNPEEIMNEILPAWVDVEHVKEYVLAYTRGLSSYANEQCRLHGGYVPPSHVLAEGYKLYQGDYNRGNVNNQKFVWCKWKAKRNDEGLFEVDGNAFKHMYWEEPESTWRDDDSDINDWS